MIRLTDTEVTRFSQMRDQANASEIGYWEIYKAIADLLQTKYAVASTDSSVLWLRGATEANADRGAFSALIRGYTESQYQLRYGTAIPTGKLQKASNEVAKNLLKDLLGDNDQVGQPDRWPKNQVPDINRIAFADATAVGDVLFNKPSDTSAPPINSAWSGSLLFSLLRSDQTNRLMQGGGDPAKIDTLNDWRDVLYAYRSYEAGVKATIAGAATSTALALFGTPLQKIQALATQATDLTIMGATLYGYASSGLGDLQSAILSGASNPTLKSAFETIGRAGANRFLDMLMGAVQGKQLLGTTTDTSFAANAKTFFDLTPSQLQVLEAKRLPSKASDIAALAKTDVNARAALVAGSIVSIKVSDAVAGLDALKLYDSATNQGTMTESWIHDRSLFVTAIGSKADVLGNTIGLPSDSAYEFKYLDVAGNTQTVITRNTSVFDTAVLSNRQLISFGGYTDDIILGSSNTSKEDRLYGGGGDDEINGQAGDDYIEGNRGADILSGGADNDKLLGGADNDILNGDAGKDELYGGAGDDRLLGGSEADTLYGDYKDPDANSADSGADTLVGGDGIDTLYGGQGNDTLYGDQESEASLEAFGWGDTLYGGKGNDILYGGSGNDRLEGGEGDDTITGGAGNDILMGGEGIDIYKFGSAADYFGKDTITDSDGKGSLQINGQTLGGTFTSYGERGAYRLKLADGSSAGLSVYNDTASSTGKSAILKFSGNLANQITIRNFDEAAAKGSQGFMGIKIDPKQAVLVKASDYATPPNPFQAWDFDPNTFAAGADSTITEHSGKSFTVYLQQGATAGSTLILNIAGAVGQGLKAILGDSTVDVNGAVIDLVEGQTFVSFSLVSDSDITADQAGAITVNYQSSGAGAGSNASSNTWALTLKDAGETENTLNGDFLVRTEKAWFDFIRLDAQGQQIVVVKTGELFYERDRQNNLVAGSLLPIQKPIYGEVDGRAVIVGYEEIPSDDETVTTNAIFGGAGKDKINGLADSDLLGGFGGNDEIDGGSGNDMIGGGKGSDNIKGGDGDDYISSSADVIKSQQQRGKDDVWQNYGLPQGKEAISTQALWGTYKDTTASSDGVTIWAGITETDTSRTEGDVIDAGAGDDWVIASWGDDRVKGGEGKAPATTNLIALRADNTPANCRKRSKNFRKTNQRAFQRKNYKRNQPVAFIDIAQRAAEIVVSRDAA